MLSVNTAPIRTNPNGLFQRLLIARTVLKRGIECPWLSHPKKEAERRMVSGAWNGDDLGMTHPSISLSNASTNCLIAALVASGGLGLSAITCNAVENSFSTPRACAPATASKINAKASTSACSDSDVGAPTGWRYELCMLALPCRMITATQQENLGGLRVDIGSVISVAGAVIAADFALAIKRPRLHEKLDRAITDIAGMALMLAVGVWAGAFMVGDLITHTDEAVQTAIDTVDRIGARIGAAALAVLVCHMLSILVAQMSREDEHNHSDRNG